MKNNRISSLLIMGILVTFIVIVGTNVYSVKKTSSQKGNKVNLMLNGLPTNKGHVSYQLIREDQPNEDELAAYHLIQQAMDSAVNYYNTYTTASKQITVYYLTDESVRADGNINGNIRFGPNKAFMNVGIATHEVGHTIGIGTSGKWLSFGIPGAQSGIYTFSGKKTTNILRQITGDPNAQLFLDYQHFWPYGLNYAHEYKAESDLINYCKLLNAMIEDGL